MIVSVSHFNEQVGKFVIPISPSVCQPLASRGRGHQHVPAGDSLCHDRGPLGGDRAADHSPGRLLVLQTGERQFLRKILMFTNFLLKLSHITIQLRSSYFIVVIVACICGVVIYPVKFPQDWVR